MNKKIGINETLTEDVHYKFSYHGPNVESHVPGSFKSIVGSSMFAICVRPPGGLKEAEIKSFVHAVLSFAWVMYYSIGVEVVNVDENANETRHMHIHMVTNDMMSVRDIKEHFRGVLDDERIVSLELQDGKLDNKTVKIDSCSRKHLPNKTPMAQLAYPLKGAADGKAREYIAPDDYNNAVNRWTNLFDDEKNCTDEVARQQWASHRITFAHLLSDALSKKKHNAPYVIHSRTANDQAQRYARENALEWSKERKAAILATMVTDKLGERRYILAPTFGLKRGVVKFLDDESWQKDLVQQALEQHFEELRRKGTGGTTATTRARKRQIKELQAEIQSLKESRAELDEKVRQLKEEKAEQTGKHKIILRKMQEGNVKQYQQLQETKEKLRKRDHEFALAVMEVEQYRDGRHPMQDSRGEWKNCGRPEWRPTMVEQEFEKAKRESIQKWRREPHFVLGYAGVCKAPLPPPCSQKRPRAPALTHEAMLAKRLKVVDKK